MTGFTIGGVCYRSMVHTSHLGSVITLAACSSGPMEFHGIDYQHSSNLPAARADWLRRQIDNREIHFAVSADSDSEFNGYQLWTAMCAMQAMPNTAIGIVPMYIGGGSGLINVNIGGPDASRRITRPEMRIRFSSETHPQIHCGGFGVVAFNLGWFRREWRSPTAERVSQVSEYGEDIEMCLAVRRRKGEVCALRVNSAHRDLIGGDRSELFWT